jgi:pimeloyl-ACP methyl ester carboxylesterase
VHVFAHSQGGMVGSHLALEGEYRVETLVGFGNPLAADVGGETLSVDVRHSDDPVAALAAGGHNGAVGAPGSMVIERVAHPVAGLDDVTMPAHHMSSYAETAALIDASPDPRVGSLHAVFDELNEAVSVEVTEYSAKRG